MAIDIGPDAIDRSTGFNSSYTDILTDNPANATGTIDTIELWFANAGSGVKIGTFYGSGTSYTNRDYATIGDVPQGSKQTFTGLSIEVEEGDLIGSYFSGGQIEGDTSGYSGLYETDGDQMGTGVQTYTFYDGQALSMYGTGTEGAPERFMTATKYW